MIMAGFLFMVGDMFGTFFGFGFGLLYSWFSFGWFSKGIGGACTGPLYDID